MNSDQQTFRKVIAGVVMGVAIAASTLWAIRHYKTLDERRSHRGEEWTGGDFYFGNELVCLKLDDAAPSYRYDVTVIPRPFGNERAATIFYQRRETQESGSRLVLVEARRIDETHVELGVTIAASPSNIWSPAKTSIDLPAGAKLYHGQPDPIGRSHFTIRYESTAGAGTIDAWLTPDNTIQFETRPIAR